jgi:DNA-binding transcriptional LysR family regulator
MRRGDAFWKLMIGRVILHRMNVSSFDLNHARALHYLLEEAHVARAARRLGITAAAASNALRRLRGEFDDQLLVRQGRLLTRTPLAEALRLPARELLLAADQLLTARARFDPALYDGAFDVTMSDGAAMVLLTALDRLFSARAPRARLRLRLVAADLVTALRSSINIAVTASAIADAALMTEELFSDRFVCLLRRRHPLATGPWSAQRFAAAAHLVVTPTGGGDTDGVDEALGARGLLRRATRLVPTFALAPPLLVRSDLIATVPASFARLQPAALGLIRRKPPLPLRPLVTRMAWHLRHAADPRLVWLRQLVRDAAAESGL